MVQDYSSFGIIEHINGKIIDINHVGSDMIGYSKSELIGKNIFNLLDEESKNLVKRVIEHGIQHVYTINAFHKNGSIVPLIFYPDRNTNFSEIRVGIFMKQGKKKLSD